MYKDNKASTITCISIFSDGSEVPNECFVMVL